MALIDWCQQHDVLYLDTCVEPWAGGYDPRCHPAAHTTNYWLRQEALRRKAKGKSTCVIAHGANPGLVSHFIKLALSELAASEGLALEGPPSALARALGIKAIHIAERDTQTDELSCDRLMGRRRPAGRDLPARGCAAVDHQHEQFYSTRFRPD